MISRRNFLRAGTTSAVALTAFTNEGLARVAAAGARTAGMAAADVQDNPTSWLDWAGADRALEEFTRRLVRLRRDHPVFRRRGRVQGRAAEGRSGPDIGWFSPYGQEMTETQWQDGFGEVARRLHPER